MCVKGVLILYITKFLLKISIYGLQKSLIGGFIPNMKNMETRT